MRHALAFVVAATALPALAQTTDHSTHAMTGMESPATVAFMEINDRMHGAMAIDYTGNVDVDFVKGMIPHHQGAVEMAKVELANGTDPEVRKLAEAVIAAQEAEIAWMQAWLARQDQ